MPTKRSRSLALVAFVALVTGGLGAFAGVAVANHQWSDVPTGNFFHESIDNFTAAGCASGYPDGTFHPTEPVLRQQMARFVNSCGGRIWFDEGTNNNVTTSATTIATAEMVSGAVGDGAGRVLVTVTGRATTSSTSGFPCEVDVQLGSSTPEHLYLDLPENTGEGIEDVMGSVQQSFLLPADSNSVQQVTVKKNSGCAATIIANVQVSATYWPFDASGDGWGS
jgi:hypothetical protein